MVDGGAQGLAAKDYLRKPRCPSCWTCGLNKIVDHIKIAFWWRRMWSTVGEYMRSYPAFQLVKSDQRKRVGGLQPTPLPEQKWQ